LERIRKEKKEKNLIIFKFNYFNTRCFFCHDKNYFENRYFIKQNWIARDKIYIDKNNKICIDKFKSNIREIRMFLNILKKVLKNYKITLEERNLSRVFFWNDEFSVKKKKYRDYDFNKNKNNCRTCGNWKKPQRLIDRGRSREYWKK
jgi:hypothetical protein